LTVGSIRDTGQKALPAAAVEKAAMSKGRLF
jgi:hypothetical protein